MDPPKSPKIPLELVGQIARQTPDHQTLSSLSLVSQGACTVTRKQIFRHVKLMTTTALEHTAALFKSDPVLITAMNTFTCTISPLALDPFYAILDLLSSASCLHTISLTPVTDYIPSPEIYTRIEAAIHSCKGPLVLKLHQCHMLPSRFLRCSEPLSLSKCTVARDRNTSASPVSVKTLSVSQMRMNTFIFAILRSGFQFDALTHLSMDFLSMAEYRLFEPLLKATPNLESLTLVDTCMSLLV